MDSTWPNRPTRGPNEAQEASRGTRSDKTGEDRLQRPEKKLTTNFPNGLPSQLQARCCKGHVQHIVVDRRRSNVSMTIFIATIILSKRIFMNGRSGCSIGGSLVWGASGVVAPRPGILGPETPRLSSPRRPLLLGPETVNTKE